MDAVTVVAVQGGLIGAPRDQPGPPWQAAMRGARSPLMLRLN
jgi:hypothetical protein